MESLLSRLIFMIFTGWPRGEASLAILRSGCGASGAGVLNSYTLSCVVARTGKVTGQVDYGDQG